jgi:hypothetical protein
MAIVTAASTPPRTVDTLAPPPAAPKTPVFIQSEVHDAIGALYVAKLKDALEASKAFRADTEPASARLVVGILTMDPNESAPESGLGRSTAAAVTLQLQSGTGLNPLIYSWVLVARRDNVDSLAAELVAAIDMQIQELITAPALTFDDGTGATK